MSLFSKKDKDISESVENVENVENEATQEVLAEQSDAIESTEDVAKSISSASKLDDHIPTNNLKQAPSLTYKEQKSLKRSRYAETKDALPKTFLIKNKKNGRMAEVNGVSAISACSNIGWRPRHCTIIETHDNKTSQARQDHQEAKES